MTAIALLEDVHYQYPDATLPILRDVSWEIEEGSFTLLIGQSGSGKSTLLRTLNGLVPHFTGGRFGGDVIVRDINTRRAVPRDMSHHVGFVFQDPEAQMLTDRVDDEIAFGLEQHRFDRTVMRKRVEELLDLVGVAHLRDRSPSTLSGGERQRVAIASALATHPRVLVLDEPTSQLDPWGAEEVISALSRINDDLGVTIVVAEHRLERLLSCADTVRLVGPDHHVFEGAPQRIAQLLDPVALPPVTRLARLDNWEHMPMTVKDARRALERDRVIQHLADRKPAIHRATPGPVMMRMHGATVQYGARAVLDDVDLEVRAGEFVALLGRNGSGKTTVLRSLLGFQALDAGAITTVHGVLGRDVDTAGARLGYVPQRASSLFFNEKLSDELRYSARQRGVSVDVRELLSRAGLDWAAERHPMSLSVGERQRAAVATIMAGKPDVLLLDEPTRGLDPWHKGQLMGMLQELRDSGVAVVMATHDIEMIAGTADRVVMLGDGNIVADGSPEDVLTNSLTFTTQMNLVFGDQWLTTEQVMDAVRD